MPTSHPEDTLNRHSLLGPGFLLAVIAISAAPARAQAPLPAVPEWAQPGSPTHTQVPPPTDFHRPDRTSNTPIGVFQGQSDVGAAIVPGSSTYDAATGQYTINSAGYNIWYTRDEFRYLWKKISGDVSSQPTSPFPTRRVMTTAKLYLSFDRAWTTTQKRRCSANTASA
jgi:hypothetical protein